MGSKIKIGIIGGSGLSDTKIIENFKEIAIETPYGKPSDILVSGTINGVECVLLSRHGRGHTITPSNVNYQANIWALKNIGCTHVIATNACGSLTESIVPGDFVIPDSFIDLTKQRTGTFFDGGLQQYGKVLHIPMKPAFCEKTRAILIKACRDIGVTAHEFGTVVIIEGPRFSSRAESLLYRSWGADLINMTMMPEVVLAKEIGLCYASIAIATDFDCWHTTESTVCVVDVLKVMEKSADNLTKALQIIISKISQEDWDSTFIELKKTIDGSTQNK